MANTSIRPLLLVTCEILLSCITCIFLNTVLYATVLAYHTHYTSKNKESIRRLHYLYTTLVQLQYLIMDITAPIYCTVSWNQNFYLQTVETKVCKISYTYKNDTQTNTHSMHTNYTDSEYQNIYAHPLQYCI